MLCKYSLIINDTLYELPEDNSCVKNWDEISRTLSRVDYCGVTRSFSSLFEFTGKAYDLILQEYLTDYLDAKVTVEIYTINNKHVFEKEFGCPLDFSSIEYDGYVLSIHAKDCSLASLIKSRKSTQCEYLVSDLKEEKQLYYDRLSIYNSCSYYPYDKNYDSTNPKEPEGDEVVINYSNSVSGNQYYVFPLSASDQSEIYNGSVAEVLDNLTEGNHGAIIRFTGTKSVKVSMKFNIRRSDKSNYSIRIVAVQGSQQTVIREFKNGTGTVEYSCDIPKIYLSSGSMLKVDFVVGIGYNQWIAISQFKYFTVRYSSIDDPVNIDVVTPVKLLNSLLKSMNDNKEGITGEIITGIDSRLDDCLIIPAESARAIPDAKIYSSYTKFQDWMEAEFGFVPTIDDDNKKVTFTHRNNLFNESVVKSIDEVSRDFSFKVNSKLIYSRVCVGYEKKDYDSINGRDEFRFTNEYITGVDLTDNTLNLISPYRADAYGIEFLVQKRGKDTTDNESDNDIFFVCAKFSPDSLRYELVRDGYVVAGVISPDTMFNVMYSPRFMIQANSRFIGVFAPLLTYASSDGNSDVSIDGIKENGNIRTGVPLFTVGELTVTTDDYDIPSNWNGLIALKYADYAYSGYIYETENRFARYDGVRYKLLIKSISSIE